MSLPFHRYPGGGRTLLGRPKSGDGTARHGYGLQVHEWCGFECAYCGSDLGSFEGWLQLSIDHVVPQQMVRVGYPREWIEDIINIVVCCMPCNGLFNRDPAVSEVPSSLDQFLAIRDALFQQRKVRIVERRETERRWYEANILPKTMRDQREDRDDRA